MITQWFLSSVFGLSFALVFGIWAVIELVNHLIGKMERIGTGQPTPDKGSYWLIIVVVCLLFNLAFLGRLFDLGMLTGPSQYVGLALLVGGVVFRQWAVITLGRHFSVVVAIEPEHELVTQGPYRWLRHPAYTGGFMAMLGFQLALGNWLTALLTVFVLLPAFIYRIWVEEQALHAALGIEYVAYARRTWRLFPGW